MLEMKSRHLANKVTASHAIPIKTIQIFGTYILK